MPPGGPGYSVDDSEMRKIIGHLEDADSDLGMKDFSERADLNKAVEISQSVSPHENIEQTVDEAITKLTRFVDVDYKNAVQAVQGFIDRAHDEISEVTQATREGRKGYQDLERENQEIIRKVGPPDGN